MNILTNSVSSRGRTAPCVGRIFCGRIGLFLDDALSDEVVVKFFAIHVSVLVLELFFVLRAPLCPLALALNVLPQELRVLQRRKEAANNGKGVSESKQTNKKAKSKRSLNFHCTLILVMSWKCLVFGMRSAAMPF